MTPPSISVVIPTYNRGAVLLDTVQQLLSQTRLPDEILLVDQTQYVSGDSTLKQLELLESQKRIRRLVRGEPSIPKAMNHGLCSAASEWVLFIDDDVRFEPDFIQKHLDVVAESSALAHIGQIVQPWQGPNQLLQDYQPQSGLREDHDFLFNSNAARWIKNCMAGNLCVNRSAAIDAGGFDENFFGVAFRFETEFGRRFCDVHKTKLYYSPIPLLHHLHIKAGGTRSHANFLTSTSPVHSMGDYYYAMVHGKGADSITYMLRRFFGSFKAKFYLVKPWYLPLRLLAEFRGLFSAVQAYKKGSNMIDCPDSVKTVQLVQGRSEAVVEGREC